MRNVLQNALRMSTKVLVPVVMLLTASPCLADLNEWTWMSGSNIENQSGDYGTKGVPADSNIAGARMRSISWIDASGDLWLFGGDGYDSNDNQSYLNDLWRYDPDMGDNGTWTWMSGHNEVNEYGRYGTQGVSADSNRPGARDRSISWIDASGDLWLFGGYGYDADNNTGILNDLWRYDPDMGDNGTWIWMSGHNEVNEYGRYGTKGVPADSNIPGARIRSISWIDASGDLWLFGGQGLGRTTVGFLNDLWRYDPDMGDNGTWTWMSGHNEIEEYGRYGTKGVPADSNIPGARGESISWIDASGDLWLFGGYGYDSNNVEGHLNDLWRYDPDMGDNGTWTWMSGHNEVEEYSDYGTTGVPADSNIPGARIRSISWIDASGDLWLFGGEGWASTTGGYLNDLWRYDPDMGDNGTWIWMSGHNEANEYGRFGTKGVPADSYRPGGRDRSISWIDASGDLWLFGGHGRGSNNVIDKLNDLWRYEVPECLHDGGCLYGRCLNNICVECVEDDHCFNGSCVENICVECESADDCINDSYCDGTETCNAGVCESINIPCASRFCDEDVDFCQECLDDEDCLGGVCVGNACFDCRNDTDCGNGVCEGNICTECMVDTDCDNGEFCDGIETCNARACETSDIPCASRFCDEVEDICMECTENDDCFGWFCEENMCVECLDETDCDNDLYCDGAESCDTGICTQGIDPCPDEACDEVVDECVECLRDYDCADMYMCQSALCVPRCELTIKHKALSAEKLKKKGKKLKLLISGGQGFDPRGNINPVGNISAVGLKIDKAKPNIKKGNLKLKLMIPQGTEPQTIPIQVGECMGEIEIIE